MIILIIRVIYKTQCNNDKKVCIGIAVPNTYIRHNKHTLELQHITSVEVIC